MIEIRRDEQPSMFEDLKYVEMRPFYFSDGSVVYDNDVALQPFKIYDKKTGKETIDDVFVGYNRPEDIDGFIVGKNIHDDFILMTENGKYVSSIYPEEAESVRLFLTRIINNVGILEKIDNLDFFQNADVKIFLFKSHKFLNAKRVSAAIKRNDPKAGNICIMSDLERDQMSRIYAKRRIKSAHQKLKERMAREEGLCK